MENILLFVLTVFVYSFVYSAVMAACGGFDYGNFWLNNRKVFKLVIIAAMLALPLNIGGNVFTIAGNVIAEKSVYSVFSLYQRPKQDAFNFFSLGYQKTGRDAFNFFGLGYQKTGRDVFNFFGFGYQRPERDVMNLFGLGYQKAGRYAEVGIGLAVYQNAEQKTQVYIGMALYQRVGEKTRAFGAFSELTKD